MERKGSVVVYCIAILTDQEQEGQKSAEYIRNYCTEKHVFPLIEIYQKQEQFFAQTLKQYRQWCFSHYRVCPA